MDWNSYKSFSALSAEKLEPRPQMLYSSQCLPCHGVALICLGWWLGPHAGAGEEQGQLLADSLLHLFVWSLAWTYCSWVAPMWTRRRVNSTWDVEPKANKPVPWPLWIMSQMTSTALGSSSAWDQGAFWCKYGTADLCLRSSNWLLYKCEAEPELILMCLIREKNCFRPAQFMCPILKQLTACEWDTVRDQRRPMSISIRHLQSSAKSEFYFLHAICWCIYQHHNTQEQQEYCTSCSHLQWALHWLSPQLKRGASWMWRAHHIPSSILWAKPKYYLQMQSLNQDWRPTSRQW